MRRIITRAFPAMTEAKIKVPEGAVLLNAKIADNHSAIILYLLADEDQPETSITFYLVATDEDLPDTFPGIFFRTLDYADGTETHLFFKPPRRKPVVAPNDPGAPTSERVQ